MTGATDPRPVDPETPADPFTSDRTGSTDGGGYSIANAERFGWASLTDQIHPDRLDILNRFVVGNRVLDAGCGGGGYVAYLTSRGFESVGLEANQDFLALGLQRRPPIDVVAGDITAMPFEDDSFDTVLCFDVLEHIADESKALLELARVARRRLLLAVPLEEIDLRTVNLTFLHYQDTTHVRYYDTGQLRRSLRTKFPDAEITMIEHLAVPRSAAASLLIDPRGDLTVADLIPTAQIRRWQRWAWKAACRCLPRLSVASLLGSHRPPPMPTAVAAVVDLKPSGRPHV